MGLCQTLDDTRRHHSLDFLADLLDDKLLGQALAQSQTKTTIARLVVGTGQDQITHSGQPHQGFGLAAQSQS